MSFLYENSKTWRWIVASCKASRPFFVAFSGVCILGSTALGFATMSLTSYNDESLNEHLAKKTRRDTDLMARVNKERLAQLLSEIKNNENTEDRYAAALRGEILTGPPNARVRGYGGTSWQPLPQADIKEDKKESASE
eukprot:c19083_g1_i1 orf=229-642(+)